MIVLVLSGCGGGGDSEADNNSTPHPEFSPTPFAQASVPPPFSPATEPTWDSDEPRFVVERPDPLCPPITALTTILDVDREPYDLTDPFFDELDVSGRNIYIACGYERSDVGEHDVVLDDHFEMRLRTKLHEDIRVSGYSVIYDHVLPTESTSLMEWEEATYYRARERAWREACESATPCPEGELPTTTNRALYSVLEGRVGNVEFEGRISYIAEEIPDGAFEASLAVFRDYVLAVLDHLEPAT